MYFMCDVGSMLSFASVGENFSVWKRCVGGRGVWCVGAVAAKTSIP